jgi:hypothetical protein
MALIFSPLTIAKNWRQKDQKNSDRKTFLGQAQCLGRFGSPRAGGDTACTMSPILLYGTLEPYSQLLSQITVTRCDQVAKSSVAAPNWLWDLFMTNTRSFLKAVQALGTREKLTEP